MTVSLRNTSVFSRNDFGRLLRLLLADDEEVGLLGGPANLEEDP